MSASTSIAEDADSNTTSQWTSRQRRKRLTATELSGSCGDFGTLLPLLVALAKDRKIYLAPTLLGTGIVHILNGFYWDVPMPLQPMKSIASLAIAGELSRLQVTVAGVGMGILFLGPMVCLIDGLNKWIPKSVIGGLQLGVGWKLAIKGIHIVQDLEWWKNDLDCVLFSLVGGLLCLYWLKPPIPSTTTIPITIDD